MKTFEIKPKRMKNSQDEYPPGQGQTQQNKQSMSISFEDSKNNNQVASIEKFNQQIGDQSLSNGTSKLLGLDCTQSLLPIPKQSRSRQKSDLSNSVCSSGSYVDDDIQDGNIDSVGPTGNGTNQKSRKKNQNQKNSQIDYAQQQPQRRSTRKVTYQQSGLKKKSTQIFGDLKQNINTSTFDQENHSIKKKQRRGNIVIMDKKQQTWQKNWVQIMYYIGKMKKFMKQTVLFFRPQLLTKWQLNSINDKACDFSNLLSQHQNADYVKQYSYQKYQRFISFKTYKKVKKFTLSNFGCFIDFYQRLGFCINKFLVELYEFLPIFNQLQKFYVFWELIIFICAVINLIYIPLEITFDLERSDLFKIYFEYICVLVFSTDIFIRSNTQYNEQGTKIEIHKQILQNYIKKRLIIDILSIISLNQMYFKSKYASLLFFMRIFYSTRIIDIFREQFLLRVHISGIISLILLFSQAMYFCHIFSCSFLALGLYERSMGEGWLVYFQLDNSSRLDQYLHSYYFSVVTMTTIGYGDFSAKTSYEFCFMIVFMIVSCGIFGYTINSIGNILYDFKLKRDDFLQQLAQINKYFKFYNTDITLQSRARKYIEYTYSDNIQDTNISTNSLESLSAYLQIEIKNDAYKKAICKNEIIKKYFSEIFIEALATKMKETLLSPDQLVIEQGQCKEPEVYFVNSGTVKLFSSRDQQITEIKVLIPFGILYFFILFLNIYSNFLKQKLTNGDVFGIEEFFLEKYDLPFNVKSVGVTSLLSFSLSDFQDLLKKYPDQVEMFCFLKDSLQYNKDFSKLQLSCYSCAQFNHSVNDCPYLFYGTKKQKILRQYLNHIDKLILTFKRDTTRVRYNARFNNEDVRNEADQFFLDNQDELSYASFSDDSDADQESGQENNYQRVSMYSTLQQQQQQQQQQIQQQQQQQNLQNEDKIQQKDDKQTTFQLQKSNSMTNSVIADQESVLPQSKVGTENLVYSNQNIPKSISNLPEFKDNYLKGLQGQDNAQHRKSVALESNILAIPSNLNSEHGERKKQRSFTSINFVQSPSEIELKPTQIHQANIQLSKYSGQNLKQQVNPTHSSRKLSTDADTGSMMVKQTSKRNIGRQISRESNKDLAEIRERKSTKNLDVQSNIIPHSKSQYSELDIFFRSLAQNNPNYAQSKQINFIEPISQVQSNYQPISQSLNVELKDLILLLQNAHLFNTTSSQSKNFKDMESKKIDVDIQPSSKQRHLPDKDGESKFHRMKSKKEQLYEIELDKIQNYTIYFPKYNIDNVIKKLQQQEIDKDIKKYLFSSKKNIQPPPKS